VHLVRWCLQQEPKRNETDTHNLLVDMARNMGWERQDSGSTSEPERIWYQKSLAGTKYEGMVSSKTSDSKARARAKSKQHQLCAASMRCTT
jgi:hypothetical protein